VDDSNAAWRLGQRAIHPSAVEAPPLQAGDALFVPRPVLSASAPSRRRLLGGPVAVGSWPLPRQVDNQPGRIA